MKIELDAAHVKDLAAEAILSAIGEEERSSLIKQAIVALTGPNNPSGYTARDKTSHMELAFREAIRRVASDICHEQLSTNQELHEEVNKLLSEAWAEVFIKDRKQTVHRMAQSIVRSMECHGSKDY